MTEVANGHIENAKNEIAQHFKLFRTWEEYSKVSKIEHDVKEIEKEKGRLIVAIEKGEISQVEKEAIKEVMLFYDAAKCFTVLENDLVHTASNLMKEEKAILKMVDALKDKGFPEKSNIEIHENAAKAFQFLRFSLRRISDMFGYIEKS